MSVSQDDGERHQPRRSWPQKLLIAAAATMAVVSFAAAGIVWIAQQQLENRQIIAIAPGGVGSAASVDDLSATTGTTVPRQADGGESEFETESEPDIPVETFPPTGQDARNILITGADNNACFDPDSRFAPAFGDRENSGERSDTIMMWRVNPVTNQVAILSFPRDLWVTIDGRSSKGRINEAYRRDDPQRLINTIQQNFGISTDHFVQVDFCAFKELVDSVGGVAVPFDTPVRDGATGLAVPEAGCFTFGGEHALAYVRSRKLEFQDVDLTWKQDGTSDLGRISRQQDFIRRVADELLANAFSPSVVRALLDVSRDYIVTDQGLTPDRILEFAGVLQSTDPSTITTYQIQARNATIQGNAVLEPRIGGDNMQAVIGLFRGEVTLAQAPVQDLTDVTGAESTVPPTTVPIVDPDVSTTTTVTVTTQPVPETGDVPVEAVPEVQAEDIVFGVRPDPNRTCTS